MRARRKVDSLGIYIILYSYITMHVDDILYKVPLGNSTSKARNKIAIL